MKSEYLDVIEKLNYYKSSILKDFIKKGIYPDNKLISSRLNSFDANLSLFKNYNKVSGEYFDANEYNESLKLIYQDLNILMQVLNTLSIKEYYKQQNFINSYMNELYSIVNSYTKRAEFENSTTSFGKTIMFKNNNFKIDTDNSTTIIDLDTVELEEGSTLACIANINNIDPDNLLFAFKNNRELYEVTAYNYSNETLTLPGKKNIKSYIYNIPKDQQATGSILMDIEADINIKNKYTILGGKDKIFLNYKDDSNYDIQPAPTSLKSFMFQEKTYVNFYIVNGNSVAFKFNKKPISANFPIEEGRINNLKTIHHFFLECDEGFSFEIELDKGNVYAIKEEGIVNNDNLYYTGTNLINDFNIIEESSGNFKKFDAQLKIINDNNDDIDIKSIIIKQIEEV